MDWKKFIIEFISATVWPFTTILLVLVLKKDIRAIFPWAERLKFKGLEIWFGKRIEEVGRQLSMLPEQVAEDSGQKVHWSDLERVAMLMPHHAILEAWKDVEAAAVDLVLTKNLGTIQDKTSPYKAIENVLIENEALPVKMVKIFRDLRVLRNKVVHAPNFELQSDQAKEYVRAAQKFESYIRQSLNS